MKIAVLLNLCYTHVSAHLKAVKTMKMREPKIKEYKCINISRGLPCKVG